MLDASVDTNQCAYVAVGVWQWWLETGDRALVDEIWPVVAPRARPRRPPAAARPARSPGPATPRGGVSPDALLTGSSSTYQALRCGVALAELVGEPAPDWEVAAGLLQHAVAAPPGGCSSTRSRFSMDWYYPVLGGAVRGASATARHLRPRWAEFVVPGRGVRCVADRPWVTGAETAELVARPGRRSAQDDRARRLLADVQHLRHDDGAYWTGLVYDEDVRWPVERSAWTAAAVVLAAGRAGGRRRPGRCSRARACRPASSCPRDACTRLRGAAGLTPAPAAGRGYRSA